jgi:transcriptional regulator GlxA family with amidase domain
MTVVSVPGRPGASGTRAAIRYILAMHVVAILALDGVVAFDLGVPCQVFSAARQPDGTPRYDLRVCGDPEVTATAVSVSCFRLHCDYPLEAAIDADTIVVPGTGRDAPPPTPQALDLLRTAVARGARIVSICTGAFVLAAAGILDGRRATTHWRFAGDLARNYPNIQVDPAVLFIDSGPVLTSAGVAAGLDLCLHMIRTDYGAAAAADAARTVVMAPQRQGGQAQFIRHPVPAPDGSGLDRTMHWMQGNLHRPIALTEIARQANVSIRTLNRWFRARAGTTPLQWLLAARIDRARELLETTDVSVDRVAGLAGFGSPTTLRRHFSQRIGTSPTAYRAAFQAPRHPPAAYPP